MPRGIEAHRFDPNKKGLCKQIVNSAMCHLPEEAEIHTRFKPRVEKHCQACNELYPEGYRFCPYCGNDLDTVSN